MGAGYFFSIIFFFIYCLLFAYVFSKKKNRTQRIIVLAIPFVMIGPILIFGIIQDRNYKRRLAKYPQYSNLEFKSPIKEIKASLIELNSVINFQKWKYKYEYTKRSFEDIRKQRYFLADSFFLDNSKAWKNISFLEKNEINSFVVMQQKLFVTYKDSLSNVAGLPVQLLQVESVVNDTTLFLPERFKIIDRKEGLLLLLQVSLN